MRKAIFLIPILLFFVTVYSQKANTAGAFKFLEKYAYGIPTTLYFKDWEKVLKNNDDYTYITRDYKKYGIIYSNLTTLKNHNTLNGQLDSVVFIMQKAIIASIDSIEKDTAQNVQIFMIFKKSIPKKLVDTLFKTIEAELNLFFPEDNITRDKYNNGIKVMYALSPSDSNAPITIERYFDETIHRQVIGISISKMKNYNIE